MRAGIVIATSLASRNTVTLEFAGMTFGAGSSLACNTPVTNHPPSSHQPIATHALPSHTSEPFSAPLQKLQFDSPRQFLRRSSGSEVMPKVGKDTPILTN
jgi:hypothetical protein